MFEKILVCLDGSELAEQILPYAAETAIRFGGEIVLLQVIPIPGSVSSSLIVEPVPVISKPQDEKKMVMDYLARTAEVQRQKGLNVEYVVLYGPPGREIVGYAAENGIGLIALATHGRSGIGRLVLGSIADFVLRESALPTLAIKPKSP